MQAGVNISKARVPRLRAIDSRWVFATAVLLGGCGQTPPSLSEADAAVKQLPELQVLMGSRINNPNVHLVTDLKCGKSGDESFLCLVLLPKDPMNGLQQTVPVRFVKLDGKWRAVSSD
jgi:hypothetical protein